MEQKHVKLAGWALVALLAVFVVLYFIKFVKRKFNDLEVKGTDTLAATKTKFINTSTICTKGQAFPLSQGSCGANVVYLQNSLNKYSKTDIATDGKFGPQTKSALMAAIGKVSVTEKELGEYIAAHKPAVSVDYFAFNEHEVLPEGSTAQSVNSVDISEKVPYPTDLVGYSIAVKTDLDDVYFLSSRKANGIWAQMLLLNPKDLATVSNYVQTTYGESLYARIDAARWDLSSTVNIEIKNKLTAAGVGAK